MVQWAGCSQSDSSSPQNLLNVVDCSNPRISRSSRIRKETVDPELPMKYLKMLPILKLQYIKTPDQLQFYFKYTNSATLTLWILLSDRLSNARNTLEMTHNTPNQSDCYGYLAWQAIHWSIMATPPSL